MLELIQDPNAWLAFATLAALEIVLGIDNWQGKWYQKENNRDGGFAVEFSPDFSEGEGRWWYSRIGADHAPTLKGGTFHLRKKASRMHRSDTLRNRGKPIAIG